MENRLLKKSVIGDGEGVLLCVAKLFADDTKQI